MKTILLFIAIAIAAIADAQVSTISLQASGLTCSMCSNAINKSLKTLDFVLKVDADIKTYTFEISFKPGSIVDFDSIRKKVESAGFTVCAFVVNMHFDNVPVMKSQPVIVQNNSLLFVNINEQVLNGYKHVKIIDQGFVSSKEYKNNTPLISSPKSFHVTLLQSEG